jgi:FkbM family methyltransferase
MKTPVSIHNCRHGKLAELSDDLMLGKILEKYGEWAEEEIELLSAYMPVGGTVIDVGANIGTHALAFSRVVGETGTVIAIEGNPITFCLLGHNIVANDRVGSIIPIQMLAGSETKVVFVPLLQESMQNLGAKSFCDIVHGRPLPSGPLQPTALCSIDSLNLLVCDLIKIDVEGMEPEVLAGCAETLRKHKPVVYFEYASGVITHLQKSYDMLSSLGYNLYYHYSNPYSRNNFKNTQENIFGGNVELNILACPPGKDAPANLPKITEPITPPPRPTFESQLSGAVISDYLNRGDQS